MAERGEGRRSIRSNMSRPLQPDFQFRRDESSAVSNGSSELARPPSVRRPVLDSTEVPNLKTIGKLGGISLIYNTMTGIGVIQAASVFQQSGWLLVVVFFVVYMIVSGICGLFIVEAMQCIPGNRFFQGTVEFATLINFYFGPVAHAAGQFCLFGALQSLAVSSIIQSSQTMDNLLIDIAGRTCGIAFSRSTVFTTLCVSDHGTMISPFGSTYMLTTAGYLVVLSFVVPLCIFPLTEFVSVQIVLNGLHPSFVPVVGSTSGYAGLIGVVMLNYAYVQAIPSWVNVKRPEVNVQWSIWTANLIGLGTYVCIGLIPALAYIIPSDSNLVAVISLLGTSNKIFGYLFSLLVLMTSIPVFLSISQLNIIQNLRINRYLSVLACYALPWAVAIPFLTGGYLLLINIWGSLIFVSTANFVVPLGIYLKAITFRKRYNKERRKGVLQKF
ncbi:hypothetical protein DFJ73DRAFT_40842 [Zopfochytrium polystomum]|nr:hypothetical protein DFJ73DRAFT_40842 [Zopfochytrium polystomum]